MPSRRTMTKPEVKSFLEALARDRPDPQTELAYTDAYTLLVAVALSAQATDASVNKRLPHCSRWHPIRRQWWRWGWRALASISAA